MPSKRDRSAWWRPDALRLIALGASVLIGACSDSVDGLKVPKVQAVDCVEVSNELAADGLPLPWTLTLNRKVENQGSISDLLLNAEMRVDGALGAGGGVRPDALDMELHAGTKSYDVQGAYAYDPESGLLAMGREHGVALSRVLEGETRVVLEVRAPGLSGSLRVTAPVGPGGCES